MASTRWTNPHQPQTLQIAVFLLYFRAIWSILFGGPAYIIPGVLMAAGGYGVANERKWGYFLAVFAAFLPMIDHIDRLFAVGALDFIGAFGISLMFDLALIALLLHPMSRSYQRIWFK